MWLRERKSNNFNQTIQQQNPTILIVAIWIHVKYTLRRFSRSIIFIRQVVLVSLAIVFLLPERLVMIVIILMHFIEDFSWYFSGVMSSSRTRNSFSFCGSQLFESRFYSRITESNRSFSSWPCSGRCMSSHAATGETTSGRAYAAVAALTDAAVAHVTRLPRCHSGDILKQSNYN